MSSSSAPISAAARMFAISASRPCRMPTFTTRRRSSMESRRPESPPSRPSRGPRSTLEALVHSACRVFQPRHRPAEFVEAGERGVEVCLVEELAAVDQIAVHRHEVDHPPLGLEALLRGPMRPMGDNHAKIAQPMHRLDVDPDFRRDVPAWRGRMRSYRRARTRSPPVVDVDPVRRRRGQLVPVERR